MMNPVGKVPVMTDGEMKMFESCAMMQYVLDRYGDGKLQPAKDNPTYAHYLQWSCSRRRPLRARSAKSLIIGGSSSRNSTMLSPR